MNTSGKTFRRITKLGACLFAIGGLSACASGQRLGRGATAGALDELEEKAQEREARGERSPFERAAGSTVKGTLDELDHPERQEQLGRVVGMTAESAMRAAVGALDDRVGWSVGPRGPNDTAMGLLGDRLSTGFAQGVSRQLRLELGANGDGPLGRSLSGWLHQASGAVATGVVAELPPIDSVISGNGCGDCIDRRVYELSRVAAAGFTDGVSQRLHFPTVLLSFGAGLVAAFAIAGMLQRYRRTV